MLGRKIAFTGYLYNGDHNFIVISRYMRERVSYWDIPTRETG